MEPWIGIAIVVVLGALAIDRTRAYRLLPALVNRPRQHRRRCKTEHPEEGKEIDW